MHSADGSSVCLMYHQRPFKLLIHRQSVDLTTEKGFVGKISAAHLISPHERLLLNNKRFLLQFFGIYSVTNRWKCLPDRLDDRKFRFQTFYQVWRDLAER